MENLYYFPPPPLHQIKDGKTARFGCRAASSVHDLGGVEVYCSINFYSTQGCRFAKEFRIPVPGFPDAFPTSFPRLSPTRPHGAIERDRERRVGKRTWELGWRVP